MRKTLLILASFISLCTYSQDKTTSYKPINFKECDMDGMFVQSEKGPEWKCDSIGFIEYLNQHIDDKELKKIKRGMVVIGFIINADGKTCCTSFTNLTDYNLNAVSFKDAVNNMPDWIPGTQNGKNVKYLKSIILSIKEGKLILK